MRPILIVAALGVAAGAAFLAFPGIDLAVSGWFFLRPTQFALSAHPVGAFFSRAVPVAAWLLVAFLVAALLLALLRRRPFLGLDAPKTVAVMLTFALGPGLLVNGILKEHWHRARPSQVQEFGGERRFTPAIVISDQCRTNCSFVSGDASLAFASLGFALLAVRRRRAWVAGAVALGATVGLVRIMQGGHFLSDVVFAGIFTALVALAMDALVARGGWRRLAGRAGR